MGISGDDWLPGKHQRLRICVDGAERQALFDRMWPVKQIEFDAVRA